MTESLADLRLPEKYRPVAVLGSGGMANVYLTVVTGHAGFNKLVVVKKPRHEMAADEYARAKFLDEARLAARMNHPNLVLTYEIGQIDDQDFIAMEYLDGQPLSRIIRKFAPEGIPLRLHLRILSDVLAGLHYAHEIADYDGTKLNVVHRDVSPQNVFVTYEGVVKVVDFGIAKASGASVETQSGTIKGKIAYMPPEQLMGAKVDRRADIFSVGVMLWEAIARRRMWHGIDDAEVISRLLMGDIPRLRDAAPDAPEELVRIVVRALTVRASERYATAMDMLHALESYLDALGEHPSARELGKFVADKFGDQREEVKRLIEDQLRDVRWSGVAQELPRLALPYSSEEGVALTPSRETARRAPPLPAGETAVAALASPRRELLVLALAAVVAVVSAILWATRRDGGINRAPAGDPSTLAQAGVTAAATTPAQASISSTTLATPPPPDSPDGPDSSTRTKPPKTQKPPVRASKSPAAASASAGAPKPSPPQASAGDRSRYGGRK